MALFDTSSPVKVPTLEGQYKKLCKICSQSSSFPKLLDENNRFADIVFRFSKGGRPYNLHRIILSATLGIEISDEVISETLNKAPLDPSLENFVLNCIYGTPLPEKIPFGLMDTLKIFVRQIP